MSGTDPLQTHARTLYAFRTPADIAQFATGCDADLGGRSSVSLALQADPADRGVSANGGRPYARFFGEMRTDVPEALKGRLRGGYAGMRNKVCSRSFTYVFTHIHRKCFQHRPTLFGEVTDDLRYL
jgi:NADH dehydrogenase [ubiquinone] 1 alpha subcomplex assembly factor 1